MVSLVRLTVFLNIYTVFSPSFLMLCLLHIKLPHSIELTYSEASLLISKVQQSIKRFRESKERSVIDFSFAGFFFYWIHTLWPTVIDKSSKWVFAELFHLEGSIYITEHLHLMFPKRYVVYVTFSREPCLINPHSIITYKIYNKHSTRKFFFKNILCMRPLFAVNIILFRIEVVFILTRLEHCHLPSSVSSLPHQRN